MSVDLEIKHLFIKKEVKNTTEKLTTHLGWDIIKMGVRCMAMIEKINEKIKEAMRNRNSLRLATLRMLKSKIMTIEAKGNVPDPEVIKIFKTYFGNLKETLKHAKGANRVDIVEQIEQELEIIQEFLPLSPPQGETERIVKEAIRKCGAKTKKDLGFVMKTAKEINSLIDGRVAKEFAVKILLD